MQPRNKRWSWLNAEIETKLQLNTSLDYPYLFDYKPSDFYTN